MKQKIIKYFVVPTIASSLYTAAYLTTFHFTFWNWKLFVVITINFLILYFVIVLATMISTLFEPNKK